MGRWLATPPRYTDVRVCFPVVATVSEAGDPGRVEAVSPPPRPSRTSTERVRRWRARNPERNRAQDRAAVTKYRATAKGMLAAMRHAAKKRGNS